MLHYIVYFDVDQEYALSNETYLIFDELNPNNNIEFWIKYFETTTSPVYATCLYSDDVTLKCQIVHINVMESGAEDVLRKIKKIIREKKSSIKTILKFIPKTGNNKRLSVAALTAIATSDTESEIIGPSNRKRKILPPNTALFYKKNKVSITAPHLDAPNNNIHDVEESYTNVNMSFNIPSSPEKFVEEVNRHRKAQCSTPVQKGNQSTHLNAPKIPCNGHCEHIESLFDIYYLL